MDIPISNYILDIGKVFQSVVESSNGSKISFNGYYSRVLVHNVRGFTILLLFIIVCSKYHYVPKTFQKPELLVSRDFLKVPIKQFCLPLGLPVPQDLVTI